MIKNVFQRNKFIVHLFNFIKFKNDDKFLRASPMFNLTINANSTMNQEILINPEVSTKNETNNFITCVKNERLPLHTDSDEKSKLISYLLDQKFLKNDINLCLSKNKNLINVSIFSLKKSLDFLTQCHFRKKQQLQLLTQFPDLSKKEELRDSIFNLLILLKSFNLSEDSSNTIVSFNHSLIDMPISEIKMIYTNLTNYFVSSQIKSVILNSPRILSENWQLTKFKLNYLNSEMSLKPEEIAENTLLNHPLEKIMTRHRFLEYSGIYKKLTAGDALTLFSENIKDKSSGKLSFLKKMIELRDEEFVKKMTKLSLQEYQAFKEMIKLEMNGLLSDSQTDSDLDNDDDDDDEYTSSEDDDDNYKK